MIDVNTATTITTAGLIPHGIHSFTSFDVVVYVDTLLKKEKNETKTRKELPRPKASSSANLDATPRPSYRSLSQSLSRSSSSEKSRDGWRLSGLTMTRLLSDGRTAALAGAPVGGRGHGRA